MEDQTKIRAGDKNGTRPATDISPPGLRVAKPPIRVNGDIDGLQGSKLSDEDTRDFRMAELQKKPAAIEEVESSSPVLRISFKTPDQGKRAEKAI